MQQDLNGAFAVALEGCTEHYMPTDTLHSHMDICDLSSPSCALQSLCYVVY